MGIKDERILAAFKLWDELGEERMKLNFPFLYKLVVRARAAEQLERELTRKGSKGITKLVETSGYTQRRGPRGKYKKTLIRETLAELEVELNKVRSLQQPVENSENTNAE